MGKPVTRNKSHNVTSRGVLEITTTHKHVLVFEVFLYQYHRHNVLVSSTELHLSYVCSCIYDLIHIGRAPRYMADSVQSIVESSRRLGLRSADTADYIR